MVSSHARACLEPEVLAAYVDHGLSLAERARVETHLASCPQCTSLLAGVVRTVADVSAFMPEAELAAEATPLLTRRAVLDAIAAAAAVIAILVLPSLLRPWLEGDAGLVSLVDSVGEQRSVLGRLTGGFPHAPLVEPSAGGQGGPAAGTDRVLLAAGRIRESFGELQTPSRLHALGISDLLAGRHDDAAHSLLAASREQPANAQYLSDVATVQLERARLGLRPDDLPRALATADRARRLDPSLHEAWFNRALALSALSLHDQAKTAWADYLTRESDAAWVAEARVRLQELSKATPAMAWGSLATQLEQSIDPASADAAVRAHTTEARQLIENQLLPAWAAAAAAGNDTRLPLERLKVMAEAMLRVAGDALYSDAVAAIERAQSSEAARLALARAHLLYGEASRLYADDQYSQALPALRGAKAAFEAATTPYVIRPMVDIASIVNLTGQYAEAAQLLESALATAVRAQYGFAGGRATWLQGLVAFQQGRLAEAQAKYEDTLAAFERLGDAEQRSAAHLLLAGLFHYLGDAELAWRHFGPALRGLDITRSPRFRHGLLSAAATALRSTAPEASLAIQNETVRNAEQWGREAALAEALALRAALRAQLSQREGAERDIEQARLLVSMSTDAAFKSRLEVPVLATESEVRRLTNPTAAIAAAERAIALVQGRRDRFRLAQLQLRLARANMAAGRMGPAEAALERGITAFDEERRQWSDEGRLAASDEAWGLFETSIEIAIRKKDFERAFALAERARARTLSETRKLGGPRTLAEIRAALGPEEAIVALNQFEDAVAIWVIRRDEMRVVTRPMSRADARRLVARQQDEIRAEAATALASQQLFDEILRPVWGQVRTATRLVFVPDATYEDAAFGALWNRATRRFLVADATVRLASSAGAIGSVSARAAAPAAAEALIFSRGAARDVAELYRSATVYEGDAATRTQFFANAAQHRVVHLAAPVEHSVANPMLSRILVADDPGQRHSGAILAGDIATRSLRSTQLVVVDDHAPSNSHRDEGTLNVARAFLTAGVPEVLVTLPGASDDATRDLMISFHREFSQRSSAEEALSTIQRNALQQNGHRLGAWTALVLYGSDR